MTAHHAIAHHTAGLVLTEHTLDVPLDHARPDGPRIPVLAREVADPDGRDKPLLVYLEGGPGSHAPRPMRRPATLGWLDRALLEFRVILLDQRDTGRSTPVGALPGLPPAEQAAYLTHFRADRIVRDAEVAQRTLPDDHTEHSELLTAEHVFPWTFEQYGELAPLREAAHLLAEHEWPRSYDAGRPASNEAPAAAVINTDDLSVERAYSEEIAAVVRALRPWITSEYEHDGRRADGARVLGRLLDLARGRA